MKSLASHIYGNMRGFALLIALGLFPQNGISGEYCRTGYEVHLTFDDGPSTKTTPKILKTLKKHKIKATFFLSGEKFVLKKPGTRSYKIARLIANDSHRIGAHSYFHFDYSKYTPLMLKFNLNLINENMPELISNEKWFRFPYGNGWLNTKDTKIIELNRGLNHVLSGSGWTHIGWDIDSRDWAISDPGKIEKRLLKKICKTKGGVILFHDTKTITADNLDSWIVAMKRNGHRFTDAIPRNSQALKFMSD